MQYACDGKFQFPATKRTLQRRSDRVSETTTHRNIIYRLLPGSKENARRLAGQAGACRFVWNEMLAQHNAAYEAAKESGDKPPSVSFFSLGREFTSLRNEIPWLSEYSFGITRYCLKYQADAWKAFFRGDAERPRFKSKYGTTPSFTIPDNVRIDGDRIAIPRIGTMRIRRKGGNPYPDGRPVQAVIRKEAGKWYVTVCYAVEAEERADTGTAAGVDMNVGQVAVATSAGEAEIIPVPDTGDLDAKIGRNQRRLGPPAQGIAAAHEDEAPPAEAPAEAGEQAPELAAPGEPPDRQPGRHGVCREPQHPGDDEICKGYCRQSRYEREGQVGSQPRDPEHRLAWPEGEARLQDRGRRGEPCIHVADLQCMRSVDKASRRTQSDFTCVACGHADNAALNAARNITASGTGASARRGAFALATPATRETDRKLAA